MLRLHPAIHRPTMRPRLIILLLLGAGACSAQSGSKSAAALPSLPLVRAALLEWAAWGGVVIEGWPEARPADTMATPERFARLLGYWRTVPGGTAVARRLQEERTGIITALSGTDASGNGDADEVPHASSAPVEDIGLYAYPAWSAAFVSAMARQAGIPESDLPSSARHAGYIDAVLLRAAMDPQGARFRPYAPEERVPAPGDLLCADRSTIPLAHWSMRLLEMGQARPMHCDIVVHAGPGLLEAVGGNVKDLVALRRLPTDATGHVSAAPPGFPPFILILAAQDKG